MHCRCLNTIWGKASNIETKLSFCTFRSQNSCLWTSVSFLLAFRKRFYCNLCDKRMWSLFFFSTANVTTECRSMQNSPHFLFSQKLDRLRKTLGPKSSWANKQEVPGWRHVALAYPTTARTTHTTTPPPLHLQTPLSLHPLLTRGPTSNCPPSPRCQPEKKSSCFSPCHVLFVFCCSKGGKRKTKKK